MCARCHPLTCCGYFWPPGVASLHCIQQVSPFRSVPSSLTVAELPPAASSPHQLGVTGRGLRPTIPPPCSRSLRRRRTFPQRLGRERKKIRNLKGKSRYRKLVRTHGSLKSLTWLAGDGVSAADPNFNVTF